MVVIAVDGPGGVGKSTVARGVAEALEAAYLDTDAYYRAVTLAVLRAGVSPGDGDRVLAVTSSIDLDYDEGSMLLDGEDVTAAVRSDDVTGAVSEVSAYPDVREQVVAMQRSWVDQHGGRAVVEGRDIGSDVFPDARYKFYLDASPEVRARRRYDDLVRAGTKTTFEQVFAEVEQRDRNDMSRPVGALRKTPGSIVRARSVSLSAMGPVRWWRETSTAMRSPIWWPATSPRMWSPCW